MNNGNFEHTAKSASFARWIPWLMALVALAFTAIYLSRPLYDPDFYWHLKTGQWIWQNKALPHTDLFGIPPLPEHSPRTEFIYTSYWLVQLILYGFYAAGGMWGIILFRWLVAALSLVALLRWARPRTAGVPGAIALGVILLLEYYFIERPQFISFIGFGALLIIVLRFLQRSESRSPWALLIPLPLLMVAWANMHGGFLIGQAILIYFLAAEGLKLLHPSLGPLPHRDYRLLAAALATALIASFINPNALNLIRYLPIIFDSNYYVNTNNLEELSLPAYFRETGDYTVVLYGAAIALTLAALLCSRYRKDITWVGILAGTAFMGWQHMRLMPFFLVAAMVFVTKYFETAQAPRAGKAVLLSMLAITALVCTRDEFPRIAEAKTSGWVPVRQYPVTAADFMAANNLRGNVYTTMPWGGYMLWRVGPESKIFYDGRGLNVQRAWEYDQSRTIALNQRPYWKGLFETYAIQVAVVPVYEDDGSPSMLTQSIYRDPEWAVAFADERNAVFVRKDRKGL